MDLAGSVYGFVTDTSVLLGLIILALFILLSRMFVSSSNGLPPGPKFRLPVVGNMYAVEPDMRKFLRKYRKTYGYIYSLYFGNTLVIIIAGYDKIKEAFVKNASLFSDRPKGKDIFSEVTKGLGFVNRDGELWKEHRKFALTTLRQFGLGKSILEERIHGEIKLLLKEFEANEGKAFNPAQLIYVSVSNVLNAISFGAHFEHGDVRYGEMLHKIEEQFSNIGNSAIGTFIPALALLPGDLFKIKKTLNNADIILGFLRKFVNEHLERYDENNIDDFASAFIKEMKQQESSKEATTFTVDQLVMVLAELFMAGAETTSTALRWMLVYLVNYPDIQEKLFQDISGTVGLDNLPSLQDRTKLPFLDAFMQECLRHANMTFTSGRHAAPQNISFSGYRIPMEATILADIDSVFNDRTIWKDPEIFRPQRFIAEDGALLKVEEFIPFFVGRRSCIGESLAKMEMFLFMSAIIQHFKLSAPPGEDLSLETVDGVFGFVHVPKPYNILATSRGKLAA